MRLRIGNPEAREAILRQPAKEAQASGMIAFGR
jgi:hypothetical protein